MLVQFLHNFEDQNKHNSTCVCVCAWANLYDCICRWTHVRLQVGGRVAEWMVKRVRGWQSARWEGATIPWFEDEESCDIAQPHASHVFHNLFTIFYVMTHTYVHMFVCLCKGRYVFVLHVTYLSRPLISQVFPKEHAIPPSVSLSEY